MLAIVWWGCAHGPDAESGEPRGGEPDAEPPALVAGPTLAPVDGVGGARLLEVETDVPTTLRVRLEGPGGARDREWPASALHRVPLIGLRPMEEHLVTVALTGPTGTVTRTLAVTGDPLPIGFPELEVLALDVDRVSPGWTVLATGGALDQVIHAMALDEALVPVWWTELDVALGELLPTDRGTLLGIGDQQIVELDWLGAVTRRWTEDPTGPEDVRLRAHQVHHEVVALPDGTMLTLAQSALAVDAYPAGYDALDELRPAVIQDNEIVVVADDGAVLRQLSLASALDTTRVGFGSLEVGEAPPGLDWAHANAVLAAPDGAWVVSLRHQDAIVKVTPDGEVRWILGDPAGWRSPLLERVLQPVGALRWPYHAHAPELGEDGRILLFDNANRGHTPYTPPVPGPEISRLVELRVDEAAGTVEQVWQYEAETDGPLFSGSVGDADRLENGNVLGVWGRLTAEGGIENLDAGRGRYSARIVEIGPDGAAVAELRIGGAQASAPEGWGVYRAERFTPAELP